MTLTAFSTATAEALRGEDIESGRGKIWSAHEQWFTRVAEQGEPLLAEDLAWPERFRRISRALLRFWGLACLRDGVDTALTEMLSNALIHGGGGAIGVRTVRTDTGVWIAVADNAPPVPPTPLLDPDAEHGRGLLLVAAVSDRWGIKDRSMHGKWTWAFFSVPSAAETEGAE
ncbi:ATP-binding protein [Streptomyces sp. NPDC020719]|uniref:ATP-binding protein n=1 Tax=Streptomyces sp. NPDC020719 TaxID=3154896 RepID=UPI0034041FC0